MLAKYAKCALLLQTMKKAISATIEDDLIKWMNKKLLDKKFRNKSHLIEVALDELRKKEENEK